MKEFDWDKFLNEYNNISVHCKTEEESINFNNEAAKHGLNNLHKCYNIHKNNTTYEIYLKAFGCGDIEFCKANNRVVLEWSDFMKTESENKEEQLYTIEELKAHPMEEYIRADNGWNDKYRWNNDILEEYNIQTLKWVNSCLSYNKVNTPIFKKVPIKTVDFNTALHSGKLVKCVNYKKVITDALEELDYPTDAYLEMNLILYVVTNNCSDDKRLADFIDNSKWIVEE